MRLAMVACALISVVMAVGSARAESPEEWVKLGARVHGGYGAFIPLGVKIGLDAVARLKAEPRQLSVLYYDSDKSPCACFADGVAIATYASFGQRTMAMARENAPEGVAAVIVIRPRAGGIGYKYTIPLKSLPRLRKMNEELDPLGRHEAVMKADGLFEVATVD
jgi:formylmethanofuran dehydrogenase subunit E